MTSQEPVSVKKLWQETPRIDDGNLTTILSKAGFDTNTISGTDYWQGMRLIGQNIFPNSTAKDGLGVYIAGPVWLGVHGQNGEGLITDHRKPPLPDCIVYREGTKVKAFSPTQAFLDGGVPNVLSMQCANLNIHGLVSDFANYAHHGLTMHLTKAKLVLVEDITDADGNVHPGQPCVNKVGHVINLEVDCIDDAPPPESPNKRWELRTLSYDIGNIFLGNADSTTPKLFTVERSKNNL